MLDPKLSIPRVMVGGLVFGGVVAGCGGDDGGTSQADVTRRLCNALEDCDPDEFDQDYASQAECRTELNAYFDEFTQEYGAACGRALVAYYACILPEYTATCDYAGSGCDDEYDAFYDACY
ncbi:MAG: hypothetical protein KC593_20395 [Myxococcales bacterium]|nr:hypothetical protein [Myxococcales bacterium]